MAINTGYRAIPANTQRVEYNTELVRIENKCHSNYHAKLDHTLNCIHTTRILNKDHDEAAISSLAYTVNAIHDLQDGRLVYTDFAFNK